ncbi:MAG: hypothetical protein ABJO01_04385 [Parasphingorhabdus sp.]|uniref:hypothetical protein n=1 Tax=Parasphingorhabdus sp. TaxID=2709688 RepID=UPI003296ED3B
MGFFAVETGADPLFLQHLLWFFGHPEIWISLILVAILALAAIRMAQKLWQSGRKIGFAIFAALVLALTASYIGLALHAQALYVSGDLDGLIWWTYAQYLFFILSLLSALWIFFDWFKQRH